MNNTDFNILLGAVLIVYESVDMGDNVVVITEGPRDFMTNFTEIKHFNQVLCIDLYIIESSVAILFLKFSIRGKEDLATSLTEYHSKGKFFLTFSMLKGESGSYFSQMLTFRF